MIYDGDIIERGGYKFRVNFPADEDHEAPWDDGDGRGIVREMGYRDYKKPGERILQGYYSRSTKFAFDWQGTIAKAKEEGWGLGDDDMIVLKDNLGRPPTKGEKTAYAVEREFQHFRQWLNDDWWYVGIVITHIPDGENPKYIENDYGHAVWGFENNDKIYLEDEAERMVEEYVHELNRDKADEQAAEGRAKNLDDALAIAVADIRSLIYESVVSSDRTRQLDDELDMLARAAGLQKKEKQDA